VSRLHILARTATLSVLLASFVLTGCHPSSKSSAPTLAFGKVAAAYQESPYKTDISERDYKTEIIEGRATGARPGQPIFHSGSRNFFDPANVWTDERGALHLRISGSPGKWNAAELKLTRSLGYGTYRFQVRDVSHLEPSALLTLNTWDGVGTESDRHELDVELGRWGYLDNTNVKYVVQPYYVPANSVAFRVPPGPYTHWFRWEPGKVTFSTVAGSGNTTGGRVISEHVFTSGVPSPEGESVRIALYVFHQGHIPLRNENEVVIDKFEYLP
jgi:hypothetical protein